MRDTFFSHLLVLQLGSFSRLVSEQVNASKESIIKWRKALERHRLQRALSSISGPPSEQGMDYDAAEENIRRPIDEVRYPSILAIFVTKMHPAIKLATFACNDMPMCHLIYMNLNMCGKAKIHAFLKFFKPKDCTEVATISLVCYGTSLPTSTCSRCSCAGKG